MKAEINPTESDYTEDVALRTSPVLQGKELQRANEGWHLHKEELTASFLKSMRRSGDGIHTHHLFNSI
jgi:hypothetical protein